MESTFDDFARKACVSRTSMTIEINQVYGFQIALSREIRRKQPNVNMVQLTKYVTHNLILECPTCGRLSDDVGSLLFSIGAMPRRRTFFTSPNAAALTQGRCPGCGRTIVNARFIGPSHRATPVASGIVERMMGRFVAGRKSTKQRHLTRRCT